MILAFMASSCSLLPEQVDKTKDWSANRPLNEVCGLAHGIRGFLRDAHDDHGIGRWLRSAQPKEQPQPERLIELEHSR